MKKIWIKKFKTFEEEQKADLKYYLKMSPIKRLDIMQFLREMYNKFKGEKKHAGGTRLRRTIKIIQQA